MISNIRSWFVLRLFLGYVFIASGIIVNFLMLCSCVIWPFNKKLYRTIAMYLAYSHWINFTFLGQWWSRSDVTLILDEKTDQKYFGKEHAIVILNHKYDIDWLMGWLMCERLTTLGGSKIYGKQMLKYVPLLGWAWYFTESIFLKRDWEQDRKNIIKSLMKFSEFPYPVWILLFCEGTRFTDKKHKKSLEYAEKMGLTPLKHHLVPRTKGFTLSVQALKGTVPAIYDCVIGFKRDAAVPTLRSIYRGSVCKAEMKIRRIPLEDIPCGTDAECAAWLHKLYEDKDATYEYFVQNGTFEGRRISVPRRPHDLIMWLFWATTLSLPLFYFIMKILMSSLWVRLVALGVIVTLAFVARWMIHVTRIDHAPDYSLKYSGDKKDT